MSAGKLSSQVAHASVSVLEKVNQSDFEKWRNEGMKKVVLKVKDTEELLTLFEKAKKKLPCALITDAGKTQIAEGSKTCFACGPIEESEGQKYFKELKLL
jgi:PTH2 family peptidyl-tRNA hydrolase